MKYNVSKADQIKAILASGNGGADGWSEKHIGIPSANTFGVRYADVFNVTEQEVYDYVMQNGWDERVVANADWPLPSGDEYDAAPYFDYALLPERNGLFPLGVDSMTWPERPRWATYNFPTDKERTLHVIDNLMSKQVSFWGGPPRLRTAKEWDPSEDGSWTLRRK